MMEDNIKVTVASLMGVGNWLTDLDIILKIGVSAATLFYIVLKCREQLNKNK